CGPLSWPSWRSRASDGGRGAWARSRHQHRTDGDAERDPAGRAPPAFGAQLRMPVRHGLRKAPGLFGPPLDFTGCQTGAPQRLRDGGALLFARMPAVLRLPQIAAMALGELGGAGGPQLLGIGPPLLAGAREPGLFSRPALGPLRGELAGP